MFVADEVDVAMRAAADYAGVHYYEGNPTAMTIDYVEPDPHLHPDGGEGRWSVVLYGDWTWNTEPLHEEAADGG